MHQKPLSCPWPCPLALITVVKTKGRSWASRFEYTADQIFGEKISECQEVKRLKVAGPELHFGLLLSMLQGKKGNHKEIKFNQISQKVRRWGWNIYPSHLTLPGINLIKFHRLGGKIVNNPPIILLLSHKIPRENSRLELWGVRHDITWVRFSSYVKPFVLQLVGHIFVALLTSQLQYTLDSHNCGSLN